MMKSLICFCNRKNCDLLEKEIILFIKRGKKMKKAYGSLSVCILMWAFIPVISKWILRDMNQYQMLYYSTLVSFIVMGIILLWERKTHLIKQTSIKKYIQLSGLGLMGCMLYYVFLYGALKLTTASEGFILAYTWPMQVLILSFMFREEKPTFLKVIGVVMGFIGIVIINTKGNFGHIEFTSMTGNMLAVAGAFIFALYSVLAKRVKVDRTFAVFIYFMVASVGMTIWVSLRGELRPPEGVNWIWIVINGSVINGVSYLFWFYSLQHGKTHIITNVLYLTPFVSLIYIAFFLKEPIHVSAVLGLLAIVGGLLLHPIVTFVNSKSIPKTTPLEAPDIH